MENILAKLLDPAIWIVGLLVGLAARFLGQYLETRWGVFWGWTRARREQLRSARDLRIEAWSQDQGLLTIAILRALETSILMFGVLITDISVMVYIRTTYLEDEKIPAFFMASITIMTVLLFFIMWKSTKRIAIARECFDAFIKTRELPALGK